MTGVIIPDARGGLVWIHGANAAGDPVKLGMVWGYNAAYVESGSDTDAAAGTVVKTLGTVPAGEVWVVHTLVAYNGTRTVTVNWSVMDGAAAYLAGSQISVTNTEPTFLRLPLIVPAGGAVRIRFFGTVLNDDLYWYVTGYKMKVA